MQISVTGRLNNTADHRGFTLLELLVVLMIVGIVTGAIGLSVDPGRESLKSEAERLTALLRLAGQEAVLTGREYAVEFESAEYRFFQWDDRWHLMREKTFRPRKLPDGFHFDLYLPGEPMSSSPRFSADKATRRIYLLSSGETTPFKLRIIDAGNEVLYGIDSTGRDGIVLRDRQVEDSFEHSG